jgi:hypothetical protein
VSAAIKESLHRLNQAVGHLEKSVASVSSKVAKKGGKPSAPDLFAVAESKAPSNINAMNVKHLATRLDTAINKVEQILKEGRA